MEGLQKYLQSLSHKEKKIAFFVLGLFVLGIIYLSLHHPPKDFPVGQIITIDAGESLQDVADTLYLAHAIQYEFVFKAHVILQGGEKRVIAGDYLLDRASGPADLAYRLVHGDFHIEFTKVTIPEGWTVFQIADEVQKDFPNFDRTRFLDLAKGSEGYLFPETYFISSSTKPETIVDKMKRTFDQKVLSLPNIRTSEHSVKDIIIMASILEDEARTTESRKIISGILWKRLALGMALQVDSTFLYINGKNTYELTASDLKIKSPYNTYIYRGLPPTPIGNPGLDAIMSALEPTASNYLYYLSSKDGTMHYATTFAQHIKNRQLYLR